MLEYKKKFNELALFWLDLVSTEKVKGEKFECALDLDVLLGMGGGGYPDFEQSYEKACIITWVVKSKQVTNKNKKPNDHRSNNQDLGDQITLGLIGD